MKKGKKKEKTFYERVDEMMQDDPLLIALKNRTAEEIEQNLIKIGVLDKNGKVSKDYINKFSGHSRGPKVAPVKRLKKTA